MALLDWAERAPELAVLPFGGGSSVVGGVEPAVGEAFAGTISLDLSASRPRARGRPREPRRAHPGRHARSGAGGGAQAPGADPSPLPAELRVFHAWRLDRDPLRRPFRDPLHPYRRLRGEPAHGDPRGRAESRAPARLGRRAEPRPAADRLRGCVRRDHRGLAAAAGPADFPRRRRVRFRRFPRGRPGGARGRARPACIPPTCACSMPTSAWSTASTTAAALLVLAFEAADHPVDAWRRARWNDRRTTAAGGTPRCARRPGPGAPPSSACPMPAKSQVPAGHHRRHLRDRDHLGPLRGLPRPVMPARPRRRSARRPAAPARRHLPLHPRLSGRPGALFHLPCARPPGRLLEPWRRIKSAPPRP